MLVRPVVGREDLGPRVCIPAGVGVQGGDELLNGLGQLITRVQRRGI